MSLQKPLYRVLKKEALCGLELFIDRLARTLSSISINNRLIEGGQHYEKGVARFFVFFACAMHFYRAD